MRVPYRGRTAVLAAFFVLAALVVAPLGVEAPAVRADATSMAIALANSSVEPGMLPHKATSRVAQISEPRVLKGAGLNLVATLLALAMVLAGSATSGVRLVSRARPRSRRDLSGIGLRAPPSAQLA